MTKKTEDSPPEVTEAQAALAEAQADDTVTFTFRGVEFVVPRDVFTSARLLIAIASGEIHRMIFETFGGDEQLMRRFLDVVKPRESIQDAGAEFFEALSAGTGQGNS